LVLPERTDLIPAASSGRSGKEGLKGRFWRGRADEKKVKDLFDRRCQIPVKGITLSSVGTAALGVKQPIYYL
jgi:hypothetical protein